MELLHALVGGSEVAYLSGDLVGAWNTCRDI